MLVASTIPAVAQEARVTHREAHALGIITMSSSLNLLVLGPASSAVTIPLIVPPTKINLAAQTSFPAITSIAPNCRISELLAFLESHSWTRRLTNFLDRFGTFYFAIYTRSLHPLIHQSSCFFMCRQASSNCIAVRHQHSSADLFSYPSHFPRSSPTSSTLVP